VRRAEDRRAGRGRRRLILERMILVGDAGAETLAAVP
jgi:hypothetical protein